MRGRSLGRVKTDRAKNGAKNGRMKNRHAKTEPGHGRLLSVLFLGVLMGALDIAIVGPALPSLGRTFDVDARALAWVFTGYVLFNLIGTPLIARLSDLYGRRSLYLASVGVFAAGSLLVAMAPSFAFLLVGRAVQGFGAGGIFPVASAVIGDTFPVELRGRPLGMLGAVFGLAFLIGPVLGGVLLRYGWPWLFLINLPVAAGVMLASLRVLPAAPLRRHPPGRADFDLPGVALLSAGLAALALGLSAIDAEQFGASLSSPRVWPLLLAATVLLAAFGWVERTASAPLIDPAVLANRQLRIANVLSAIAGVVEAGIVFVPSLIVLAFAVEPAAASFLLVPAVIAMAIGAPVAGRLLDRHGSRVVVLGGSALLGAGLLLIRWATASLPYFIADGMVIGLGLSSLIGAPLRYIVLNEASEAYRAAAQAVNTLFRSVGRMAGGALLGAVIASHPGSVAGYHSAFSLLAAAVLGGMLMALGLKSRRAERETAAQVLATPQPQAARPGAESHGTHRTGPSQHPTPPRDR